MTTTTTLSYEDTVKLIELSGIRRNLSPSEIATQKKKLELQVFGRTTTCELYAKKVAVRPTPTRVNGIHRTRIPQW